MKTVYEKYKQLITEKIERGQLTPEFIEKTTTQLDYYLSKGKITQEEYDELIELMNLNDTEE